MKESQPQIFQNVSGEVYSRLVAKAKDSGINIVGPSGTASKFGVEVAWNYSESTRELSLHCLKTPFFMSREDVEKKLATLVSESMA